MPVVRSSDDASGMSTRSLTPSNDSAPLNLPSAVQVAPEIAPWLPEPDESEALTPEPASSDQAPTSPVGGGGVAFDTVTAIGVEIRWFPAASRATAVIVCEPLLAAA